MNIKKSVLVVLLVSAGLVNPTFGDAPLNDPYQILERHFNAIGGLDQLKAQKTSYRQGKIAIKGAGLEGTLKQWSERPLKLRQETDFEVVSEVSGDNGELSWRVDANGKLLTQRDENTLKRRELRGLMSDYEYADPESEIFTLKYEGVEDVNGRDCYVVKISNTVNEDIQINYYDESRFYLLKSVIVRPDNETRITYSDFRKLDGFVLPFKEVMNELPMDETITVEYSTYSIGVVMDQALFEPPAEDVEDYVFLNGVSAENVPFDYIESHLYMPVNLLGKERLWVLDCGASANVIDSSFASELGLVFEGPIKGQGASGVVNFYFVTLPPYSVGGIRFSEQKVVALNFRQMFHKALGLDVVGILGYDFLSRFVTKIDYAEQMISFYDPNGYEYSGSGMAFDSPLEGNMLSLPLVVDGEFSGKWSLDIGAPDLDFHYPYAERKGLLDRPGFDVMVGDAAGLTTTRISQYNNVAIGEFLLEKPWIGTPHEEGTGAFSHENRIGNIGNTFLRNFVLYLDYSRQQVILEKGDDFGKEFPRPKSGLQFMYNDDDEVEVRFVSPATPADDAGFQQGDIIKSINGIGVEYFDGIIALRKLMRGDAGTTYTIGILREGKPLTKRLTLRGLL